MPNSVSAISSLPVTNARGGRLTTVQQIYSDLRNLIVDLSLPPGTVLSKNEIAERYSVSQTPVREALILLEEEGLVDIFPQSRTEVSCIDVQGAREAHFLRRSVEVEIARILATEMSKEQLKQLRDVITLQETAASINDLSSFTVHDNRFHELMYQFAGVGGLWNIVDGQRAHLDRLRRLHLPTKGKIKSILRDHKAIIKAVAAHDPDAAEKAVRNHLKGTVFTSAELREHFPEYFGTPD